MPDDVNGTTNNTEATPAPYGPLSSPVGQMLQRGMNFLFAPKAPNRGMVAPVKPVVQAPIQQPAPVAPVQPNIAPTMDLRSPNNINTVVDKMVNGQ